MPTKSQVLRKDQTLSTLTEARQRILIAVSNISDPDQDLMFLGIWSVQDLLAHLVGWDYTCMNAIKSVMRSEIPAFYKYRDHDWQTYNARLVKKYKIGSLQELLVTASDSHKKLIRFVQTIPPEAFHKDFGVRFRGYKVTIQRLLEAEWKDDEIHYQQIRNFFKKLK